MLTVNFRDLPLAENDWVLDLGCGEGRHAIGVLFTANVNLVAVDINHQNLVVAQERYSSFVTHAVSQQFYLQQADARRLPFADHSFNKIICSEVLEHIPDYEVILNEIMRVLKPGGFLAVSVPRAWPEKICWRLSSEYHQVPGGHIRIFDSKLLRKEIEAKHFYFRRKHWAHALHAPYWWLRCLFWQTQDQSRLIKLYHRLLVWDLMHKPWITQTLEKCLNPILGKSVVMYFEKMK
jgi:2-polyprenyl-3-methyl-5-hydroxy-6-metoxy-1,4-benzoquinol methylase